ncbi:hypothetical protein IT568_04830 [bacterium]|nr:hypothetical protein [bacterium]
MHVYTHTFKGKKKVRKSLSFGILLIFIGVGWLVAELNLLDPFSTKFIFLPSLAGLFLLGTSIIHKSAFRFFLSLVLLLFAFLQSGIEINFITTDFEDFIGDVLIISFGLAFIFSAFFKKEKFNSIFFGLLIIIFGLLNTMETLGYIETENLVFLQKLWPLIFVLIGIKLIFAKPEFSFNHKFSRTNDETNPDVNSEKIEYEIVVDTEKTNNPPKIPQPPEPPKHSETE